MPAADFGAASGRAEACSLITAPNQAVMYGATRVHGLGGLQEPTELLRPGGVLQQVPPISRAQTTVQRDVY